MVSTFELTFCLVLSSRNGTSYVEAAAARLSAGFIWLHAKRWAQRVTKRILHLIAHAFYHHSGNTRPGYRRGYGWNCSVAPLFLTSTRVQVDMECVGGITTKYGGVGFLVVEILHAHNLANMSYFGAQVGGWELGVWTHGSVCNVLTTDYV